MQPDGLLMMWWGLMADINNVDRGGNQKSDNAGNIYFSIKYLKMYFYAQFH
jgi:hypothetical protein